MTQLRKYESITQGDVHKLRWQYVEVFCLPTLFVGKFTKYYLVNNLMWYRCHIWATPSLLLIVIVVYGCPPNHFVYIRKFLFLAMVNLFIIFSELFVLYTLFPNFRGKLKGEKPFKNIFKRCALNFEITH